MQEQQNIIECYDKTAKNYADKFMDELSKKHSDRMLLKAFASGNIDKGKFIDLGCGPGQTTKYLSDCGIMDLVGTDLSPAMIDVAKEINPTLHFETADMLSLNYPDKTFAAAVAFYAIVHFDYDQLEIALKEIKRVLKDKGEFLFSFHIGNTITHMDEFLGHQVNIDFHFFETHKVLDLLTAAGFDPIHVAEREPYKDAEYPSKRAYIWVRKN